MIFVTVYGEEEHGTAKIILNVLLVGWLSGKKILPGHSTESTY